MHRDSLQAGRSGQAECVLSASGQPGHRGTYAGELPEAVSEGAGTADADRGRSAVGGLVRVPGRRPLRLAALAQDDGAVSLHS